MTEDKYCCGREMKTVLHGYGEGEFIEYYVCSTNQEHRVFQSQTDENFLERLIKLAEEKND